MKSHRLVPRRTPTVEDILGTASDWGENWAWHKLAVAVLARAFEDLKCEDPALVWDAWEWLTSEDITLYLDALHIDLDMFAERIVLYRPAMSRDAIPTVAKVGRPRKLVRTTQTETASCNYKSSMIR
jgi:hypothetical protein